MTALRRLVKSPLFCFILSLVYLIAVAVVALLYVTHRLRIEGIEDPRRIIPIAWAGSLGAVMANFTGIREDSTKWNPHLAAWYMVRPFVGAVFGGIGYLIYVAIVQASVVQTPGGEPPPGPTMLGYVIAFTLGYREETFRDMLQRVIDLLVSAGGGDVEPPSSPAHLDLYLGDAREGDVGLRWRPSTDNVGVAGYNVYRDYWLLASVRIESDGDRRSRQQTTNGERRDEPHKDPIPDWGVPPPGWVTFIDRSVDRTKTFLYSVTAVDAAGNESRPAGPIRVGPRQRSQPSSPDAHYPTEKDDPSAK